MQEDRANDDLIQRNRELAAVAFLRGEITVAAEAIDGLLRLDPEDLDALNRRGHIRHLRGDLDGARDDYEKVFRIASAGDDEGWQAVANCNLGVIYLTRGELVEAEKWHRKSLAIHERLGRQEGMAAAYGNLGLIYQTRGNVAQARDLWIKSIVKYKSIGMPHMVGKIQAALDGLDTAPDDARSN